MSLLALVASCHGAELGGAGFQTGGTFTLQGGIVADCPANTSTGGNFTLSSGPATAWSSSATESGNGSGNEGSVGSPMPETAASGCGQGLGELAILALGALAIGTLRRPYRN